MSAFGVVLVAFGVLMMWAGLRHQKISEVLVGFVATPTAQSQKPQPKPKAM